MSKLRSLSPYLRAMRPYQWVKNTLVFLPALLAVELTAETFVPASVTFLAFCLLASGVYVFNDLRDLPTDRAHPRKRTRPFAAGEIPVRHGYWMATGLSVAGLAGAALAGPAVVLVGITYLIVATAYSLFLKHKFLLDSCSLAAFYALRVVAGGAASGIAVSNWLLAFSFAFFFSLASVKRMTELVGGPRAGHPVGSGHDYDVEDLAKIEWLAILAGGVSVLVLLAHLHFASGVGLFASPITKWAGCAALALWLARLIFIARRGLLGDDPVLFAITDWVSWLCLLLIATLAFF